MPPVLSQSGSARQRDSPQKFGRFSVRRSVKRAPEQIDATARERWRIIWISPEFRPAVIRCPPPPIRERPVAAFGVERPDVEVLDAIRSVQIVERSSLTQRPAHEPPGVRPDRAGDARTVLLRHPQRARPVAGGHSCRCARAIASAGSPFIQHPIPWSGGQLPKAAVAPGDDTDFKVEPNPTASPHQPWTRFYRLAGPLNRPIGTAEAEQHHLDGCECLAASAEEHYQTDRNRPPGLVTYLSSSADVHIEPVPEKAWP